MQHSIIRGVDGSHPSRSAARVAAQLARTPNSDVLPKARTGTADSAKDGLMNGETKTQGAVGQQHVGRFSEGIEQLPETLSKRHVGRFSAGIEQRPQGKLRRGRFSAGIEQLPRTPSRLRRGSFANGYDKVR
jgi:hypothetical protein